MHYNEDLNWVDKLLGRLDRKTAELTFDPHLFDRTEYWNLELEKVEKTVREGRIIEHKCEPPNKLCFELYFGKSNRTYVVIALFHENFVEAKTVWFRKGR